VPWAVLDTSIYIGHWERGLYGELLEDVRRTFVIRLSAVVLSELRRGARTREAERRVTDLFNLALPGWEPTASDWWTAGRLIRRIGDEAGWETSKRRDFQNDALIALTARRHGATVVTANRDDFDRLARVVRFSLLMT
jgi:predicted nucleic acid-binding protein